MFVSRLKSTVHHKKFKIITPSLDIFDEESIDFSLTLMRHRGYKMRWHTIFVTHSSFSFVANMSDDDEKNNEKPLGLFNPNQRQFFEDELRYREKLEQLHAGLGEKKKTFFINIL